MDETTTRTKVNKRIKGRASHYFKNRKWIRWKKTNSDSTPFGAVPKDNIVRDQMITEFLEKKND